MCICHLVLCFPVFRARLCRCGISEVVMVLVGKKWKDRQLVNGSTGTASFAYFLLLAWDTGIISDNPGSSTQIM